MKDIHYQKMIRMEPREGVRYATVYIKQTREQRMALVRHIRMCVTEIADIIDQDDRWMHYINTPMKGFKKTVGSNRSIAEIMTDMMNEGRGRTRKGEPKDFALAPIERWNKLFRGTDYEINLVQTYGARGNNFSDIMEIAHDE
jgi:hypothetical protein